MKYLKLSSVLVALFFAVGCGSKSIEKDGNTTQKTTVSEKQEIQSQDNQEPSETVVVPGGGDLPEGGFMPNGAISGDDGEMGANGGEDTNSYNNYPYEDTANNNSNTDDEETDQSYANGNTNEEGEYGNLTINSLTAIYFDFDRYNIRPDMKDYIKANADYIKRKDIKSVVLQGNTDEFGGDEYNTALGLKRALSVRDALVLQGLSKSMFSTISYGMHKPVCKEKTAECYAKNRRTDIVEK